RPALPRRAVARAEPTVFLRPRGPVRTLPTPRDDLAQPHPAGLVHHRGARVPAQLRAPRRRGSVARASRARRVGRRQRGAARADRSAAGRGRRAAPRPRRSALARASRSRAGPDRPRGPQHDQARRAGVRAASAAGLADWCRSLTMTVLARTFYRARKQATEWWGLIVVVAFAYLLAMGQFSAKRLWAGDLLVLTGLAIYAATLARAVMRELGPVTGEAPRRRVGATIETGHELELGLLLVTGAYILIVATGGLASFLYPLVYALVSFLLIVNKRRWIAGVSLAAACVLEILVGYASARAGLEGHW